MTGGVPKEGESKDWAGVTFVNSRREWLVACLVLIFFWAFFMYYHQLRGKTYSLFTANKCAGIAAVFLVGSSLALGPLARLGRVPLAALKYRRCLGIVGVLGALVHVAGSLTWLHDRFPFDYYCKHPVLSVAGLVSFLVLGLNAVISNAASGRRLGAAVWKRLQVLSYFAFMLVLVHFVSDKFPNWVKWANSLQPPYPPGTMPPCLFGCVVVGLWALDRVRRRPQV